MAGVEARDGALAVTGVLDFATVPALEQTGRDWIVQGSGPFFIDLAEVSYSSSAGLALLLSWLRSAASCGRAATIRSWPADLRALARVSGLEQLLAANG